MKLFIVATLFYSITYALTVILDPYDGLDYESINTYTFDEPDRCQCDCLYYEY